jgi:hypothetical protein
MLKDGSLTVARFGGTKLELYILTDYDTAPPGDGGLGGYLISYKMDGYSTEGQSLRSNEDWRVSVMLYKCSWC